MTPWPLPLWRRTRGSMTSAFLCAVLLSMTTVTATAQMVPWRTQIAASPDAQTLPQDRGADGLAQTLRKLDTWGSLLFIVAHPTTRMAACSRTNRAAGGRVPRS